MHRFFLDMSTRVRSCVLLTAALLLAGSLPASAQGPGYDLFHTGSGTTLNLPNVGPVALQGVPIESDTGNADTITQRLQSVPPGGGKVPVSLTALFLKSTSPVTVNGQSADVYVTVNNSQGLIPTSVLPQPDSLPASNGSVTVNPNGTFICIIIVIPDIIFVRPGTSVTNPQNWLSHQPGQAVTVSSDTSTWSVNPPAGYPQPTRFPSGGFFIVKIIEIQNPPNIHIIVVATLSPAQPTGPGTAADLKPTAGLIAAQTKAAIQPSGASTLLAPQLSDSGGGIACPSDLLEWTSVAGATSYQIWSRQLRPTLAPTFNQIYGGTALSLRITLSRGSSFAYKAAACNAQGCSGFSNQVNVTENICP